MQWIIFRKITGIKIKSGTDKPPNNSITPKEIEAVLKSLSTKNISGQDGFTAEFYQITKEHMIPIFLKIFHKIEREGKLPNSFYEATFSLMTSHKRPNKERELQANFDYEIDAKILNKICTKQIQEHIKMIITIIKLTSS